MAPADDPVVEVLEVRVGRRREHLLETGARCRHHERVAVVRPDLHDPVGADALHDLLGAADGPGRQPAAERFRQRDDVRRDAETLRRATGRDAQSGLDLVEDQHDPALARQLAHGLEIPRLGQHDTEVHQRRLHDQAGRRPSFALECVEPGLHRLDVVEGHRNREVAHDLRDAVAVRERGVLVAAADAIVRNADRDHHRVVVAVVGTEDLEDRVATGMCARDPNRVHRRLRARVREAPLRQAPPARELLGDEDRIVGRHGEVRAEPHPFLDRLRDRGMGMALHHRAEAVVEIDAPCAVDVPDVRALAALEVDRPRVEELVRGRDAADENRARPLEHTSRSGRRLVEPTLLALGQLAKPIPVDRDVGYGAHDFPILLVARLVAS